MESIETLNKRLIEYYSYFEAELPNYRLVFSDDQYEVRLGDYTDYSEEGIFLREVTEFRNVKKYPFIKHKWILEKCLPSNSNALVTKVSYESIWTFGKMGDPYGEPIFPKWIALQFIIDNIHKNMERISNPFPKYTMKAEEKNDPEGIALRIAELEEALYGCTDKVGDAIASKNAVVLGNRDAEIPKEKVN